MTEGRVSSIAARRKGDAAVASALAPESTIAAAASSSAGTPPARTARAAAKRAAILDAALDEFSARGFADARLDDVAKRAGVAKGTIYLYFKDKEALFQELVRTSLVPLVGTLKLPTSGEVSVRAVLEAFAEMMVREILHTRRGNIIRLVISEGRRFPSLAEFHYNEVIARGIAAMRALISFGIARGEIHNEKLKEFPQLIVAPALVALIWDGMFGKFEPLDVPAMLRTHIDLILGSGRPS
jgi:AcrR family transcriptional regulator